MPGNPAYEPAAAVENTKQHERFVEPRLIGQGDEVVAHLVEHRAADGELGAQLQDLMGEPEHGAGHGTSLGGNREPIAAGPRDRERPANANEGRERRKVAVLAGGLATRKLVAHLSRK